MRHVKGLSRNSILRRIAWFLRGFFLYGEIRWKHASDSVLRSPKIDRPKMQVKNRELIRPRKDPLKAEAPPRFENEKTPAPSPEPPTEPAPAPEKTPAKSAPALPRLVNPESLLPAPSPVRRDRKRGSSSKKIPRNS